MDIVGENIRKIRRSRGLLQKELAGLANIDPSNLSKLERGEYTWTKENLERIAKALDVEVVALFTLESAIPMIGYGSAWAENWRVLGTIDAKLDQILMVLKAPELPIEK